MAPPEPSHPRRGHVSDAESPDPSDNTDEPGEAPSPRVERLRRATTGTRRRRWEKQRVVLWSIVGLFVTLILFVWQASLPGRQAGSRVADPTFFVTVAKAFLPLFGAAWAIVASLAASRGRPVPRFADRWVVVLVAIASLVAYYDGFQFGYARFIHRHDQYHDVLGAKYFRELGYDGLYVCTIVAESELDDFDAIDPDVTTDRIEPASDARLPTRRYRDLGSPSANLVPVSNALANPSTCKSRFDDARWASFRSDVRFFRSITADDDYWFGMQQDSGLPRSPLWHVLGGLIASLGVPSVGFLEALAWIDVALVAIMFAVLAWAFGLRVAALSATYFGCQAIAPWFWVGGGFLEMEWLVVLVVAGCCARKGHPVAAAVALAYGACLSWEGAVIAVGWLLVVLFSFLRTRTFAGAQRRFVVATLASGAMFVALGAAVGGTGAYAAYIEQTRSIESREFTNDMGLRVVLSHDFGGGPGSGRMEFAQDPHAQDEFAVWRAKRAAHYGANAWLRWVLVAATFAAVAASLRRTRRLWVGGALAPALVVASLKVVASRYAFFVLSAPLARHRRWVEAAMLLFASLTQILAQRDRFNDDRYATLSVVAMAFTLGLALAMMPRSRKVAPRPNKASEAT